MGIFIFLVSAALLTRLSECNEEKHVPDAKEYERLFDHIWRECSEARRHTPPFSSAGSVDVQFGLSLLSVESLDTETGVAELTVWDKYTWKDERLSWDPKDYGGATMLRLPSTMVWLPDVVSYTSLEDDSKTTVYTVVSNDGNVIYVPIISRKTLCDISEDADKASCSVKVGSWTYDGNMLDLNFFGGMEHADVSFFKPSGTASGVFNNRAEKHIKRYPEFGDEPYIDLTFDFDLDLTKDGRLAAAANAETDAGRNEL